MSERSTTRRTILGLSLAGIAVPMVVIGIVFVFPNGLLGRSH